MKFLPNGISILRLVLSPCVFVLTHDGHSEKALILFSVLALSDALDGILARYLRAVTTSGKFLDPVADKSLLFFGLLSITTQTDIKANLLLLQLQVGRDIFLIAGTLLLRRFNFVPEPSFLGKLTTFALFTTIVVGYLCNIVYTEHLMALFMTMETLSLVLITLSALDYTLRGINFLRAKLIMDRR